MLTEIQAREWFYNSGLEYDDIYLEKLIAIGLRRGFILDGPKIAQRKHDELMKIVQPIIDRQKEAK